MVNLPIDVLPNSSPPRFCWRQIVDTPVGSRVIEHEGMLPPNIETAVQSLIGIAKQLALENNELKVKIGKKAVTKQSETATT
jgi:hypothetical protein